MSGGEAWWAGPAQRWHVLVVDVDSKDLTCGMSAPPAAFTAGPFLRSARALLRADGLLAVNVACRDEGRFEALVEALHEHFAEVWALQPCPEDLNRVLFALPAARSSASRTSAALCAAAEAMTRAGTARRAWDREVDLVELAGRLARLTRDAAQDATHHKGGKGGRKKKKG